MPIAVKVTEAVDAAQQLFEGAVEDWRGDIAGMKVFVKAVLLRWPWIRPNPYQPKRAARVKA